MWHVRNVASTICLLFCLQDHFVETIEKKFLIPRGKLFEFIVIVIPSIHNTFDQILRTLENYATDGKINLLFGIFYIQSYFFNAFN